MPYVFNDRVASPANSQLALIEDTNLHGGYRVVATLAQLDALDFRMCKVGMLVRCLSENKIFELKELSLSYNDDGDEVLTKVWEEFKVKAETVVTMPKPKPLSRWSLSLRSTILAPGATYKLRIPVSKVVAVGRIEVDSPCLFELKETEAALSLGDFASFQQTISHEFVANKLVYDNAVHMPEGTKLRSRYLPLMQNKDPNIDRYLYYTVTNNQADTRAITAKFIFVALQLS